MGQQVVLAKVECGHMRQTWLPQSQPSGVSLGILVREVFLMVHPKIVHSPYPTVLSQHPLLPFVICILIIWA